MVIMAAAVLHSMSCGVYTIVISVGASVSMSGTYTWANRIQL